MSDTSQSNYYDMFSDSEIIQCASDYIINPELFGIFRLKTLEQYNRTNKQEEEWKKILQNICKDREAEYIKENNEKTIENIMKTIPEIWIKKCMEHLNKTNGDIITWYAGEEGFSALKAMQITTNNQNSNESTFGESYQNKLELINNFNKVDDAILSCPEITNNLIVLRGVNDGQIFQIGDKIINNTPKSASFTSMNCEKHTNGTLLKITIPKGKQLAYNESEDQIIYPTGSILIVENIRDEVPWATGKYKTYDVTML